jgi:mannose-1-phosphate guanylyltransferase
MRAMIMAAGLGTRLRPLTGYVPKPMAPILNRPALYHILRLLRSHGVREVVVNLHHFPDAIRGWFGDGRRLDMSIRWAYEEQLLGTAGGVKNNEDFLTDDTFLVMSGDSLTDLDLGSLLATHRQKGGVATLAVKKVSDPSEYGVVVVDENDRIGGFQEKPSREEALSDLCNCGIYVFEPTIFDRIPAATFYDFGKQVFPELVADGTPFYVHRVEGYWNDVGNLEEYVRSNFDALRGEVSIERPGTEVRPGVLLGERSVLADGAETVGPVLIGDDCLIEEGARLVGPLVVGDGVAVESGAEIRASVVGPAAFLGGRAEVVDSLVGRHCHVRPSARLSEAVLGDRCLVLEGATVAGILEPNTVLSAGGPLPRPGS